MVRVWASSPPGRHTNPPAILGGPFQRTSYAGPRHTPLSSSAAAAAGGGDALATATTTPSSWWAVDLGARHRLLVNYYTLRHDGSSDGFARGWRLQGSNDLRNWATLREHGGGGAAAGAANAASAGDRSLRLPGQFCSWPVVGASAARPFRAFRLVLTQPASDGSWHFVLSQLELYGLLTVYPRDHHCGGGGVAGGGGGGGGGG